MHSEHASTLAFSNAWSISCILVFSFESCNGILGSVFTINKSIEVQFMKKFFRVQLLHNGILDDEFLSLLPPTDSTISSTSLGRCITNNDIQLLLSLLKLSHAQLIPETSYRNIGLTKLLSPIYQGVFDNEKLSDLTNLYEQLHPVYC